jgi:peptide/nickel transport system ATP-binding protein
MADVLEFDGVTVVHRGRRRQVTRILDDVSFSIGPGEVFGLVGESGCGKSTVALATMRYLPAGMQVTKGRIGLEGRDLLGLGDEELRRLRGSRVAMIYQDPMSSLNPVMTIGKQLEEVPLLHGERDRARARARSIAMLKEVRIVDPEHVMERYPHQLSGGQQQRVVIAMALMAEPKLLIMDEPTTGLDVTIEAAILELVRELRSRFDAAVLFISHNLGTVAQLCDRIGVLYAGRLVETGSVSRVLSAPAHPYTRGLLEALPRLEEERHRRLKPIDGIIAPADRERIGCAFSPRCTFRIAACDAAAIAMLEVGEDATHHARCIRLGSLTAVPADTGCERLSRTAGDVLLRVQGLSKRYKIGGLFSTGRSGEVRALTGVDVEARAGATLAIVGESGCGKSTLARILSGLVTGSEGSAWFQGVDLAAMPVEARPPDLRRRIQMVFQDPNSTLNPSHTVEYALARPLRKLRGLSARAAREAVARLMERVRLPPDLAQRYPHQLSGGQRQRVAIARALAGDPDLLIADEPVSALDVSVQASIVNLIEDLMAETSVGLIIISHDLALVRHMADWVVVMYLGRVVQSGPADKVFGGPHHPYTEALLAAAPRLDPEERSAGVVLKGTMPSPMVAIEGCAFASRCLRRIGDICERLPPPVRTAGTHAIACHLPLMEEAGAPAGATP